MPFQQGSESLSGKVNGNMKREDAAKYKCTLPCAAVAVATMVHLRTSGINILYCFCFFNRKKDAKCGNIAQMRRQFGLFI